MAAGSVVGTVSVQQKIANGYTFAFIILENKKRKGSGSFRKFKNISLALVIPVLYLLT